MFPTTEDPSLGSLVQFLAKNFKNDPLCVCLVHCICSAFIYRGTSLVRRVWPMGRYSARNIQTNKQTNKQNSTEH